jgi:hypothetical protein
MRTEAILKLEEKAEELLSMAEGMDVRVKLLTEQIELWKCNFPESGKILKWKKELDTRRRGARRLWEAYLQVLTQIKLSYETGSNA